MLTLSFQHIFTNHLLPVTNKAPIPVTEVVLVWPSLFLLSCLVLLAVIKAGAFSRVARIVQSTFSNQLLQQLEREEVNAFKLHSIALSVFFILNLSFLFYKLNGYYGFILRKEDSLVQFSFFLVVLLLLLGSKFSALRVLAFFTGQYRLIANYGTSTLLVNQTLGLVVFPLVALSEFTNSNSQVFVWTALGLLFGSALLKWYRGLVMSLVEERIGLLQIFSYFCGLEILPVLTLAKFLIETL